MMKSGILPVSKFQYCHSPRMRVQDREWSEWPHVHVVRDGKGVRAKSGLLTVAWRSIPDEITFG